MNIRRNPMNDPQRKVNPTQSSKSAQGVFITTKNIHQLIGEVPHKMKLNAQTQKSSMRSGYHVSRFRGRGMTFAESRAYQPGDEIRHIDWRVTARTGQAHTKVFEEERDRPVTLFVDQTSSLYMGTQRCFKAYLAAELAIICAKLAQQNGDRVGGVFNTQTGIKHLPPKAGAKAWAFFSQQLIQANHAWSLTGQESNDATLTWPDIFRQLESDIKPGGLVVLISDFFNIEQLNTLNRNPLATVSAHSDVILLGVYDDIEENPPEVSGRLSSGASSWWYNGRNKQCRTAFQSQLTQRWFYLRQQCKPLGIGFYPIATHQDPVMALKTIFAGR